MKNQWICDIQFYALKSKHKVQNSLFALLYFITKDQLACSSIKSAIKIYSTFKPNVI